MQNFIRSLPILLCILLCSCQHTQTKYLGDTQTLSGLKAMAYGSGSIGKGDSKGKGKIRELAIRETALSLGAQSALAWRAKFIDEELTQLARRLDTIFDFNSLVLSHNILPPVLLEGRNTFNLANTQNIRISDRTYKVARQARFITTPPNWRHYLWMDYKRPDYPDVTLLPKNDEERQIWLQCVEKSWKDGIEQANTIFEENLARIKEDFSGMILYRKLLAMNMVSPPYVSHTDLGVTGDANEIHIDDRVLRITALPGLNTNSKEWKSAITKDKNALEKFAKMENLAKSAKIKITSKAWQPVITPVGR